MQEPSLEEFNLTKELIQSAQSSRDKEKLVSRFLGIIIGISWLFSWIMLGFFVGVEHGSEHFGPIQWAALGFFVGIYSMGFIATWGISSLISYWFPFSRSYSPIFDRYNKFQKAQREYETWKEKERIRLWREEEAIKKCKAEYWFGLGGHTFEHELARLLRKLGWETTVTPGSDDKGIDVFLIRDGLRLGVQCKAHRNPVGPSVVRELVGASVAAKCDGAILVALGGITAGARDFAFQQSVEIWTIKDVLKMQTKVDKNLLNEILEGEQNENPF